MLDTKQLNLAQINAFNTADRACEGLTLADLRIRLQNELSNYAPGTLISNDPDNDVEKQFINDGVSVLWPHDYQVVMFAIATDDPTKTRYMMPPDCEHVFSVFWSDGDINSDTLNLTALPHGEFWLFDKSFAMALTTTTEGLPWIDHSTKSLWLHRGHYPYAIARYARKWPALNREKDCIDPSPLRVQSIIYYACYKYFSSQLQVNTESIRYRNYIQIATQFYQNFQQTLIKDSKPLYVV